MATPRSAEQLRGDALLKRGFDAAERGSGPFAFTEQGLEWLRRSVEESEATWRYYARIAQLWYGDA